MKFWSIAFVVLLFTVALGACGEVAVEEPTAADGGLPPDSRLADAALDEPDAAGPTCTDGVHNGIEEGTDCGGGCDACLECTQPADCGSGACSDGACVVSRFVACRDVAPTNATSVLAEVVSNYADPGGWTTPAGCSWDCDADYSVSGGECVNSMQVACRENAPANGMSVPGTVTVTYTDAGGWSGPAACDFSCSVDYCRSGNACASAYDEQRFHPSGGHSGWYMGDNERGEGARNVGVGQRVRIGADDLDMAEFALFFGTSFRPIIDGGTARSETVQLDLRDADGARLASSRVTVPANHSYGWVWFDISAVLRADTEYVFTAFAVYGQRTGVAASIIMYTGDAYFAGEALKAEDVDGATALSAWAPWHSIPVAGSDFPFWIRSAPACAQ